MTRETVINWNAPKLKEAVEYLTNEHHPVVNVAWCDAQGNQLSRRAYHAKHGEDPTHLLVVTPDRPYLYEKIKQLPGCVEIDRIGEVRSEGPAGFIMMQDDTTVFIKARFIR